MSVLVGVLVGLLVLPLLLVLEGVLLRTAVRVVTGKPIGLFRAVVAAFVAGAAQSCASGVLLGADGGLLGVAVGWAAWSGVLTVLTGVPFLRSLVVGAVFALLHWMLFVLAVLLLVAAGVGALAGLVAGGL